MEAGKFGFHNKPPRPDLPFWSGAGRDHMVDQIHEVFASPHAVVVLTGPSGVGKTRLVAEAVARLRGQGTRCAFLSDGRMGMHEPVIRSLVELGGMAVAGV